MSERSNYAVAAAARGLSKNIGDQTIVNDVSLEVPRREIVLLTGLSGSGKSTVMRMMAGIDKPSAGRSELFGYNVTDMPQQQRTRLIAGHVAVGFQAPNLDTNLSVWDNLTGLNEARGKWTDLEQAARAVVRLGLADRLDQKASVLSGGQKLQLALARITVSRPKLLLLDEPTYALDHGKKELMFSEIADACEAGGISALIVTHDVGPAREIANREYVMDSGHIVDHIVHRALDSAPPEPAPAL